MHRSRILRAAACGVGVSLLVACTGGGHHRAAAPAGPLTTSGGATPEATTGAPATVPAPTVAWSPCPGHAGWDCGTLRVPLDHAHPGPVDVSIALTRHRADDPTRRVGSLLLNPGGPGASGIQFAYEAVGGLLDAALVQDFDVIGFDPRGVGASTAVDCVDGPTLDRLNHLDPNADTPAKIDALIAGARELAAGCQAHSGSLLAHVSTVDAAEDMDLIRAAVGDAKLTYLGFSYGTLLGATYASLFPTRVRALALDGALDPAVDDGTMSLEQAIGFEQDLNDFLADCAAKGRACPFQRGAAPTLRAAFDQLVAGIEAHPLPGSGGRTLGPAEALTGVLAPLYDRAQWPVLASALAAAQRGEGSLLLQQNDIYLDRSPNGTYDNEEVANAAVNCLDRPTPPVATLQSLAATARREAPYFGVPLVWDSVSCLVWPVPPAGRVAPLHAPGAPPIVVVGSTGDPVTRYEWAQNLARELGSGVLVTRHGDGHAGYPFSQCVRDAVDAYLVSLTLPGPSAADCSS